MRADSGEVLISILPEMDCQTCTLTAPSSSNIEFILILSIAKIKEKVIFVQICCTWHSL